MEEKIYIKTPVYQRIIENIIVKIACGVYVAGGRLPSVRNFAEEYAVNPNTVQRALSELEKLGFLDVKRGEGCFVKSSVNAEELREQIAIKEAKKFATQMENIGYSKREAYEILSDV